MKGKRRNGFSDIGSRLNVTYLEKEGRDDIGQELYIFNLNEEIKVCKNLER